MILGLLKEPGDEMRVALLPELVKDLVAAKVELLVEKDAGAKAFSSNSDYEAAGAKVVSRDSVFQGAEVLIQIHPPSEEELKKTKENQVWISIFNPLSEIEMVKSIQKKKITTFSLDSIPRT